MLVPQPNDEAVLSDNEYSDDSHENHPTDHDGSPNDLGHATSLLIFPQLLDH